MNLSFWRISRISFLGLIFFALALAGLADNYLKFSYPAWFFVLPIMCLFLAWQVVINTLYVPTSVVLFLIYILTHFLFDYFFFGDHSMLLGFGLFVLVFTFTFSSLSALSSRRPLSLAACNYASLIRFVTILFCGYALLQGFGSFLGTDFFYGDYSRGRTIYGMRQVASFFDEPAFFGLLLLALFYINLFVLERSYKLDFVLIIIASFLCFSLGLLIAIGTLSLAYVFLSSGQFRRKIVVTILVLICLLFYYDYISARLSYEVFLRIDQIGSIPTEHVVISSGGKRIINEINWALFVFEKNWLFGFGLSEYGSLKSRTMALNGFVELLVRWGVVGVFFFFLVIITEKINFSPSSYLGFGLFIVFYFAVDGAISKPLFWLPLLLVLIGERVIYYKIKIVGRAG